MARDQKRQRARTDPVPDTVVVGKSEIQLIRGLGADAAPAQTELQQFGSFIPSGVYRPERFPEIERFKAEWLRRQSRQSD